MHKCQCVLTSRYGKIDLLGETDGGQVIRQNTTNTIPHIPIHQQSDQNKVVKFQT